VADSLRPKAAAISGEVTPDLAVAVEDEAARFVAGVLAPLDSTGHPGKSALATRQLSEPCKSILMRTPMVQVLWVMRPGSA